MAMVVQVEIFWFLNRVALQIRYRRFVEMCCFHLQGQSRAMMRLGCICKFQGMWSIRYREKGDNECSGRKERPINMVIVGFQPT
jgi:hypothetical protein